MIDKITAKIKRYPFQTGIVIGVIICLLLSGFFSLFDDNGRTLAGNSEIIREDYLRMSINEYRQNGDDQLAEWRYDHLGGKAAETLKLMRADESIEPWVLVNFADAVGQTDKIGGSVSSEKSGTAVGTPANPKKGLSGFAKVLLIILGLGVVAAGALYVSSLIRNKKKQKSRGDMLANFDADEMNVITDEETRPVQVQPNDTLFDLDSLFPQSGNDKTDEGGYSPEDALEKVFSDDFDTVTEASVSESTADTEDESEISDNESEVEAVDDDLASVIETIESEDEHSEFADEEIETIRSEAPAPEVIKEDNDFSDQTDEPQPEEQIFEDENDDFSDTDENTQIASAGLEYEMTSHPYPEDEEEDMEKISDESNNDSSEQQENGELVIETGSSSVALDFDDDSDTEFSDNQSAEKPLVETDKENETENEDELLKMIRAGKTNSDEIIGKGIETVAPVITEAEEEEEILPETADNDEEESEESSVDDILIHYQSQYRIGNDMYDEVFSIDQGDVFRGECGIGIGETLNNTDPKAVTAFEVWLFDKDDIHTATWYLMSDFALQNDSIRERLEQRGKCDRIRRGDLYTLETETLTVEIKILELEYGNEMEEKNSYFTNVVFDVIAKQK